MVSGPERKISVVIPFYKGKRYIAQTIESVVRQPYKDIEILLINDGSPDDGDEVCRTLAAQHSCIQYFNKKNEGIGATRNFGIDHATGTYIAFLDQDDVWVKDFLDEDTVDAIFNGGDVVCFSLYNCNHDFSRGRSDLVQNSVVIGGGAKAVTSNWKHHSSMFFRRAMILEHGIRAPLTRHEDEIFRHKCLYVSEKVTSIDKLMFLYRNNPSSETHRKQKVEDLNGPILKSWKELLAWHQELHPNDTQIHNICRTMICIYAIEGIEALYASHRKEDDVKVIAKGQLCHDDIVENMGRVVEEYQRNRMAEYLEHPKIFARKNRIKGYGYDLGRSLMKIPFVRSCVWKKRYPTVLGNIEF